MIEHEAADDQRIPVIQEEAHVIKRQVAAEQVRVHTAVEHHDVTVRDHVGRERIEVRRVRVEREVAAAPPLREEGDVTVISVLEERLVVEKRLFLVEEIHLVRHRTEEEVALPAELRRTVVTIERSTPDDDQQENN